MSRIRTVAWLATFLAPVALAAQTSASTDTQTIARLEQVIGQAIARPEAAGLSVAVARRGQVIFERGVGMADIESATAVNEQTMFRIGSVTKQFTAAAIMKLVERNQLSLEDDVRKYAPDFDTGGRKLTIRQLLNHTSGLPSYTDQPAFQSGAAALDLSHAQLLAYVKGVPFDFEPGKGWKYSKYRLLPAGDGRGGGQRQDLRAVPAGRIFSPLGLTRTRHASERDIIRNRAQGYTPGASGALVNDALTSMNPPGAAGALGSSAGDLVRWQMALTGGRAVSADSFRQMSASAVPMGNGAGQYGFGLMINDEDGKRRISHGGGIAGFNSMLVWLPGEDLHVAVISSSEALNSDTIARQIIAATTGAAATPVARTTPQPGGSAAVRRVLEELARGEPNYALMAPGIAAATRQQLPAIQPALAALGAVESVTFVNVSLEGADVYNVKLANGSLIFLIHLDEQGRVEMAGLQPGAPPSG